MPTAEILRTRGIVFDIIFVLGVTPVSIHPIQPGTRLPESLLQRLCTQLNNEITKGTTFPFTEPMSMAQFQTYWFSNFAGIMMKGRDDIVREGRDWESDCLGMFMVLPRYPGRSAHVCTGQFLICDNQRGKGAGKVLVNTFIDWAMKLVHILRRKYNEWICTYECCRTIHPPSSISSTRPTSRSSISWKISASSESEP